MRERSIATSLILTLITCGLYGWVWIVYITDDTANVTGDRSLSGGTALLLTLITCGLYGIYWNYKIGKQLYDARLKKFGRADDQSILYLILSILGFSVVSYCLMQDELNQLARNN